MPMNSLPIMMSTQLIGSCWGEGLRAWLALLPRPAGARLAGAVRAWEVPERPEDPLPGGFPEEPLDVRVAMLGRLTRRVVDCAPTRRSARPSPTFHKIGRYFVNSDEKRQMPH
ncbi:hypothetical protein GCM10018952_26910 [Streptosporangium vulgare]